jgi:hypothetical protein
METSTNEMTQEPVPLDFEWGLDARGFVRDNQYEAVQLGLMENTAEIKLSSEGCKWFTPCLECLTSKTGILPILGETFDERHIQISEFIFLLRVMNQMLNASSNIGAALRRDIPRLAKKFANSPPSPGALRLVVATRLLEQAEHFGLLKRNPTDATVKFTL